MKINVFRTQLKIGSTVQYRDKEYRVADFDRNSNEVCLYPHMWVRCTEVELIKIKKNKVVKTAKSNRDARQWASSFIGAGQRESTTLCPHGYKIRIDILEKGKVVDCIIACPKCWGVASWEDKVQI